MMNFASIFGSSTKNPMLIPEYYDQWVDCMEDYMNRIDEDLSRLIRDGPFRATLVKVVGTPAPNENITVKRIKKEVNNKRCICELQRAFPPVVYNHIRGYKTTLIALEYSEGKVPRQ